MSGDLLLWTPLFRPRRQQNQEWPYVAEALDTFEMKKFARPDNLVEVMRDRERFGGSAPGVDGIHFHDLSTPEWFDVFRTAERLLLHGNYRPNQLREVEVEKPSGGKRTLQLPTIIDRTISSALHYALQLAWKKLYPGFNVGVYRTFAEFERGLRDSGRTVLQTVDIKSCFPSVLIEGVLDAHQQIIGNGFLMRLIAQVIRGFDGTNKVCGLAQGCPYSPTAMEVTLRSMLQAKLQSVPYQWHYVDNFTFLCESETEGTRLVADFGQAIRILGLEFHKEKCADLAREPHHQVDVLGLCPILRNGHCEWRISKRGWKRFRDHLQECHICPEPQRAAEHLVKGFIHWIGPTLNGESTDQFCRYFQQVLRGNGFTGFGTKQIRDAVNAAMQKWREFTCREEAPVPCQAISADGPSVDESANDDVPPF